MILSYIRSDLITIFTAIALTLIGIVACRLTDHGSVGS